MELFIYLFAALFSVLNPIGTIPIFVALTHGYTKAERTKVSLLTSLNVFIILKFCVSEIVKCVISLLLVIF